MLGTDVLVPQPLSFFRGEIQNAFAFLTERNFHRRGNAFAHGNARFDFLADGFDRAMRPQEPIGERFVFSQKSEKQMLRLDVGAAVLAPPVSRRKYDSPTLFCIA